MPSKILVIRGGALGDFILTLPALKLIRSDLPETHLEILGYPAVTRLARETGIADAVRSIEYAGLANFFNPNTVPDPELRNYFGGFDLVISYLYDPDGFFRLNMERSNVKTFLACSHRVDESSAHPAAAQLAKPLEQLALFLEDPAPELDFSESLKAGAREFLSRLPAGGSRAIALHPGSGSPRKNWPTENWIELVRALYRDDPGRPVVVISGEADAEVIPPVLEFLREAAIPHCRADSLPLSQLGAVISQCALYLGHDSGVSHLAAASGAPCLLLFGPTRARIWAPRNRAVHVIEAEDGDLSKISIEAVRAKAAEMLAAQGGG